MYKRLVEWAGSGNLFIVSKTRTNIERNTREWQQYNQFYQKNGILRDNSNLCRERKDKLPSHSLAIQLFINDHAEVLDR